MQCVDEKCAILNATVTQRTKFMELIELEPSVQVSKHPADSFPVVVSDMQNCFL